MDSGGLYLVNRETGGLDLAYSKGLSTDFIAAVSHFCADSPEARVVRAGNPIHAQHAELLDKFDSLEQPEKLHAVSIVPVSHGGEVIACMNTASHSLDILPQHGREALEKIGREVGSTIARIRAEEALRASKAFLDAIFRAAPAGIGVVSNRIVKQVNNRFVREYRYDRADLLEQSARIFYLSDEEYERVEEEQYDQIRHHGTGTVETQWIRKDGGIIDVLLNSTPMDPEDLPSGITFTALDITARKRLEEQLRRAQKLEAVGQLAGGIAHDFNNILQGILGYSEMAMEGLPSNDSRRADMEQVRNAADRASKLTRQLLAFSSRQVMQPINLNLNHTVAEILQMLRRVIGEHIELEIVPGENLSSIHADPGMLEQVIMNLCINARDAMESGGTIVIETGNESIDANFCQAHPWAKPGDFVLLTVTDTGTGMPSEVMEHIFEPFFTTKKLGKGTGLGLAMVYGVIKQHNGFIHCVSDIECGTSFRIYLPAVNVAPNLIPRSQRERIRGGTETILIAEDEDIVRNLAVRILEDKGYRVLAAKTAARQFHFSKSMLETFSSSYSMQSCRR